MVTTLAVLSKWDVTELEIVEAQGHLARRLRQRPPVIAVSAKTGRGVDRLLDKVEGLFAVPHFRHRPEPRHA